MKAPHGRAGVIAMFGSGGPEGSSWYKANMTTVNLPFTLLYEEDDDTVKPVKRCQFHVKAAPALVAALTAIWYHARVEVKKEVGYDKTTEEYDVLTYNWLKDKGLLNFGGTFNYRKIRGSEALSMHSYGIAIDMAPGANKLGQKTTSLPEWYIDCFRDQGFFWGGDFESRKDPMHFQMAIGC